MSNELVAKVAKAYTFSGAAVDLGALVIDNEAQRDAPVRLPLAMMNRHGLVAGATGTGKTKTLQLVAEQLSAAGVPVVLADVKGDLSGLAAAGEANDKVAKRSEELGDDWAPAGFPVHFLSLGTGGKGSPIRATITSFGP